MNVPGVAGEFGVNVFAGVTGAGVDGALGAGFIAGPFGSGVDFEVTGFDGTDGCCDAGVFAGLVAWLFESVEGAGAGSFGLSAGFVTG